MTVCTVEAGIGALGVQVSTELFACQLTVQGPAVPPAVKLTAASVAETSMASQKAMAIFAFVGTLVALAFGSAIGPMLRPRSA